MNKLIVGLFLLFLGGALYFYQERILFCDAAYILFRIVNIEWLQIQEHRYGSFITQSFPLMGVKLGLPLSAIVILYSASFTIFYLAVALVLLRLKQQGLAILMSFYFLLFVSDSWFWTNNEVHQGIAWMFLFFGVFGFLHDPNRPVWITRTALLFLAFLSLFSHPLVVFPFSFLWIFFLIQDKWKLSRKEWILYSVLFIAIIVVKFMLSTGSGSYYDADKLHAATHLSFKRILDAFISPMAKEIVKRSIWNYWIVPLLFLGGIYAGIRQKKYREVLLTIAFSLAYFVAVCITFPDFIPFYTETEWMASSIIATTPFVFFLLPNIKPRIAILLLACIFLVRLVYIGTSAGKFVERKEWLYTTLSTMKQQQLTKGLVFETEKNKQTLIMHWGVPEESIIASALQGDIPNRTFVVGTPDNLASRMPGDSADIILSFQNWTYELCNERYFRIDTSRGYKRVNTE